MARYYFHLRDGSDRLLDPEGRELPNIEAAKAEALTSAREILSHEMKSGSLELGYRIEVEDPDGQVLHCLAFQDAFEIISPNPIGSAGLDFAIGPISDVADRAALTG